MGTAEQQDTRNDQALAGAIAESTNKIAKIIQTIHPGVLVEGSFVADEDPGREAEFFYTPRSFPGVAGNTRETVWFLPSGVWIVRFMGSDDDVQRIDPKSVARNITSRVWDKGIVRLTPRENFGNIGPLVRGKPGVALPNVTAQRLDLTTPREGEQEGDISVLVNIIKNIENLMREEERARTALIYDPNAVERAFDRGGQS